MSGFPQGQVERVTRIHRELARSPASRRAAAVDSELGIRVILSLWLERSAIVAPMISTA